MIVGQPIAQQHPVGLLEDVFPPVHLALVDLNPQLPGELLVDLKPNVGRRRRLALARPAVLDLDDVARARLVQGHIGRGRRATERAQHLDDVAPQRIDIVGVSAARKPLSEVARFAGQLQ